MPKAKKSCSGLHPLIEKIRNEFKRLENTEFYSEKDYKKAERKYIKLCLKGKFEPRDG